MYALNVGKIECTPRIILYIISFLLCSPARAENVQVFWASDPVGPGQTVQLTGSSFSEVDAIDVTRLLDDNKSNGHGAPIKIKIIKRSENTLSFAIPDNFKSGIYLVTLEGKKGSKDIILNSPDIYWMQGDRGQKASPGGWLRLSGRNMAVTNEAIARLIGLDGRVIDLKAAAPDKWSAAFILPQSLAVGSYRVKLWNGSGDVSAWRDAGNIIIEAEPDFHVNNMELLALQPDLPNRDDTGRINAALEVLSNNGGGTLRLRAGIYRLRGTLNIPDGVNLQGEASDLVTLVWDDMDAPPDALISGVRDFAISDLTIYAQRHLNIIKGGFDASSGSVVGQNIGVRRVIVRASAFTGHLLKEQLQVRLAPMLAHQRDGVVGLLLGGRNIVVEDCDILTSVRPIVITRATDAYISGNTFHNGRLGWYGISAPDKVIFENNRVVGRDLQATGGGINTFDGPYARNVLIRNNSYETILGWDREAVTTDGPGGYYHGRLATEHQNTIRMLDLAGFGTLKDSNWEGAGFFVLQGKGLGFVARVVQRHGDLLQLDQDASEFIDQTSIVSITPMQENFLFIGNNFTDTGAAQIFGTGYKHVFAENTMVRSYAITATSLNYRQAQPNFYIQFLDNRIASTPLLKTAGIEVTGRQYDGNTTLLTLGVVIRGNSLFSGSSIKVNGRSAEVPAVRNVLIEKNEISYNDIGISIGFGVEDLILRDNFIHDVGTPIKQTRSSTTSAD